MEIKGKLGVFDGKPSRNGLVYDRESVIDYFKRWSKGTNTIPVTLGLAAPTYPIEKPEDVACVAQEAVCGIIKSVEFKDDVLFGNIVVGGAKGEELEKALEQQLSVSFGMRALGTRRHEDDKAVFDVSRVVSFDVLSADQLDSTEIRASTYGVEKLTSQVILDEVFDRLFALHLLANDPKRYLVRKLRLNRAQELLELRTIGFKAPRQCGKSLWVHRQMRKYDDAVLITKDRHLANDAVQREPKIKGRVFVPSANDYVVGLDRVDVSAVKRVYLDDMGYFRRSTIVSIYQQLADTYPNLELVVKVDI